MDQESGPGLRDVLLLQILSWPPHTAQAVATKALTSRTASRIGRHAPAPEASERDYATYQIRIAGALCHAGHMLFLLSLAMQNGLTCRAVGVDMVGATPP